jgi:hypothetical protein
MVETNQFLNYIYHNKDIVFQIVNDVYKLDINGITKIDEIFEPQVSVSQVYCCILSFN